MSDNATPDGPELVLYAVSQDAGPFHKLGSSFSVNGSLYNGPALASPVGVYLVKKARNTNSHGGGIAGALLSAALAKDDNLSTCTVADLPAAIRAQLDPKGKMAAKPVVVVPKDAVSYVKSSGFTSAVVFTITPIKFKVVTGLFSTGKARRNLAALGWQLNTPLTPTAASIHDMRSPEEKRAGQKPLALRILYIVLAIALVLAVIAIRLAGH